ncbi:hypothetical protein LTR08_002213 [Meristemomyces frigidus]|nr:hypothetical protein LTR08_002213 [Meristemomyces frigidus]
MACLAIYELAIIEDEPVFLNCSCDSFYYGGDADHNDPQYDADRDDWEQGKKHAPVQPALTRTCRVIRFDALRIFYQETTFCAHYCSGTSFDTAFDWLTVIGETNRQMLRGLELFDDNPLHDERASRHLKIASRKITDIGGRVENASTKTACQHRVCFPKEGGSNIYEGLGELFGHL